MRTSLRLLLLRGLAWLAGVLMRRPAGPVRRILYIKPDHLGDLLLATPVLAALRASAPDARISALVGPWSAMVLERNPDVDLVLACPFPGFERRGATGGLLRLLRPYGQLLRYALLLRAGRYDLALVGRDDHWWGAALAALAGVPRRVGFAVPECRPFLSDALPWNPHDHVTTQGLELVAAALGTPPRERYAARFTPAPADRAWAAAWCAEQGIDAGTQLVLLHPGTGGPTKHWLPERWVAVGAALSALPAVRLVLTGGPGEQALVAQIAGGLAVPPRTLVGSTTVGQLAALMNCAALVLGVDSGPLHLAAALGRPTVHLYGPGDAQRFGPWGAPERHRVLRADLPCSPCGVFHACPRGLAQPECMQQITPALVVAAARRLLA